jgi:glycine/D-amino acid oxidase-like deaminating enzyme
LTVSTDILVIGGGMIGAACAFRLAQTGKTIALLDRDKPTSAASYGNAGHIATEQIYPLASPSTLLAGTKYLLQKDAPLAVRPAYWPRILPWMVRFAWASRPASFTTGKRALAALQSSALDRLDALLSEADCRDLLIRNGHYLAADTRDRQQRAELAQWHADGIRFNPAIAALPTDFGDASASLFHFQDSAHLRSPAKAVSGLQAACVRHGGRKLGGTAQSIRPVGDEYEVTTEYGLIRARSLVLAAGAWSSELAATLGLRVPLEAERGYHIHLPHWRPQLGAPIVFSDRKIIVTPMEDGTRVSGFVEFGGLRAPPTASRFALLRHHLAAIAPDTDQRDIQEWMGFRPSLPDHLPMIGRLSARHPRVFCAFGHQHLGMTLSGITADLITDLMDDRASEIDLAPFHPERFGQAC